MKRFNGSKKANANVSEYLIYEISSKVKDIL
jgi:hypothetical protein